MITRLDLESLLYALRGAGLRVGVKETLAIEFLLGKLVEDPASMCLALRALLSKSDEDRVAFDRVFSAWESALDMREQAARREPAVALALAVPDIVATLPENALPKPQNRTVRPVRPRRWLLAVAAIVIAFGIEIAGLTYWLFVPRPLFQVETPVQQQADMPRQGEKPPISQTTIWVPSVTVLARELPNTLWSGIGGLGLGAGLLVLAFQRIRRSKVRKVPTHVNHAARVGSTRVFLNVSHTQHRPWARLLDRRTEDALVWGVDKYVSASSTRRLDTRRTVDASARRAPLPVFHFQRARHQREVWLWLDESMQLLAPASWSILSRLADEIEQTLRRSGLPVERAVFYGTPDKLAMIDAQGRSLGQVTLNDLDEQTGQAITAILTTGEILRKRLDGGAEGRQTRALLRLLSHHSQLCFVEGVAGSGLAELLRPYELAVIPPSELATYLGGDGTRRKQRAIRQSEVLAWAAACALPMEPLSEEMALWLRQALALSILPEALAQVRILCENKTGPLCFPREERARLWAEQMGPLSRLSGPLETLPARLGTTLLGRVAGLLRQRLDQEATQRIQRDAKQAFVGTEGEQHLRLQRALLDLWDRPREAAEELEKLAQGPLRKLVRVKLADYVPAEREGCADKMVLPWLLRSVGEPAKTLLDLGLGGSDLSRAVLKEQIAGRQLLGIGGAVGTVLASALALWLGVRELLWPHGDPHILQRNPPKDAQVTVTKQNETEYLVTARSGAAQVSKNVPAGSSVQVNWEEEDREAADERTEPSKDLGTDLASPPTQETGEVPPQVVDLREPRWDFAKHHMPTLDRDLAQTSLLEPLPTPLAELRMPSIVAGRGATEQGVRAAAMTLEVPKSVWSCPYQEWTEPKSGMVFVKVCGGDFRMGSEEGDQLAASDEKPAHPVHVDTFWIGKYEVSNRQYRKKDRGHRGRFWRDDGPVEMVDWEQARSYCLWLGGDLPTEAEWEYAARGPNGREYPWGGALPETGRATFSQSWEVGPSAISSNEKGRGPFGALNQAGNVWEWVTDCYDESAYTYRKERIDQTNPAKSIANPVDVRSGCSSRVLRGGSFDDDPRLLRSTVRNASGPMFREGFLGFRCVLGSIRQR